jgi:PiT family inorganic phosphate transporter
VPWRARETGTAEIGAQILDGTSDRRDGVDDEQRWPMTTALMIAVIVAVAAFNVTGGFHDAAEITAPGVVTQAVRPAAALAVFAFMALVGPFVAGTAVANTIGGFVQLDGLSEVDALAVVLAATLGAVVWNVITWRLAIPSSSTHALVGGLIGVTLVAAGADDVVWGFAALGEGEVTGFVKIAAALVLSPVLGLLVGAVLFRVVAKALARARRQVNVGLRRSQQGATAALAFAHGANDAQKGMGIIALALLLGGRQDDLDVPLWVVLASATTLVIGGVLGGWGIARTLGRDIYPLEPLHGATAQAGAAGIIYGAALLGGPVSTSQVVGSSITGVGAAERPRSVRWDTGASMLSIWLITVPAAAVAAIAVFGVLQLALHGT